MDIDKLMRFPAAVKKDPDLQEWLSQESELFAIARRWFEKIRACGGDINELMHDGQATACVGDAAFCYVGVYKAHVNIGFFLGALLDDPAGLLEGSGKRMRHVKLKPGLMPNEQALASLIKASYSTVKKVAKTAG